jgi:hypothetical protein
MDTSIKKQKAGPNPLCERLPQIYETPVGTCADVGVKADVFIRKACDPNQKEEVVCCYKISNIGPDCATNVILKAFFCPTPAKVNVSTERKACMNYKNGTLTVCFNLMKVSETVDVVVNIIEREEIRCNKFFYHKEHHEKAEHMKKFETVAYIEAKEEDICICNNVSFSSTFRKDFRDKD